MSMRSEAGSLTVRSRCSAVVLLVAGCILCGCRPETAQDGNAPEEQATQAATETACAFTDDEIRRWIEQPSPPAEPAGTDDACFYELAWQQLFAVTQREGSVPRFTTWPTDHALFPETGRPRPWTAGAGTMAFRLLQKGRGMPGTGRVDADIVTEAAALTPLTDQRGRWAHFSVVVDRSEYEYIRCCELYQGGCFNAMVGAGGTPSGEIDMPSGSLELKTAWRVLETCDLPDSPEPCTVEDASRYLTVVGEVQPYSPQIQNRPVKATLGLVGMHIVQKTPWYLDRIWATFEHVDNAPGCGTASAAPAAGWSFYDAGCEDPDGTGRCEDNSYCAPCPVKVPEAVAQAFNEAHPSSPIRVNPLTKEAVITCTTSPHDFNRPVEVKPGDDYMITLFDPDTCKAPPIPTQVCRTTPITKEVAALNEQVERVLGELGGSTAVLANYELAGVLWYRGSTLQPATGTALANTTMETYLQTLPTGCVTCHDEKANTVPDEPPMQFDSGLADRSMVFQQIRQFGGTCSADQASRCAAWAQGCPGA